MEPRAAVSSRGRAFVPLLLALALAVGSSDRTAGPPAPETAAPPPAVTAAEPATPVPPLPLPLPSARPLPIPGYDVTGWVEAVAEVEQRRGGGGPLRVPDELRHAADRRMFLALQLADARERSVQPPHDEPHLAQMIRAGRLVELAPLGEDHILYEVGMDAREDPTMHFDEALGKEVPLFGSVQEYEAEDTRLAAVEAIPGSVGDRAGDERELLSAFYRDPARREILFAEHAAVTALAAHFSGYSYDLRNPDDRARFQVRLLSHLHPAAREVALELARRYHARFGRKLPFTSLVRTQRYQQRLRRVNRNATTLDFPPHSTGRAFDVSYKFMGADEQNFVMDEIARLEAAGRVQALRERLNHIHVYVYDDGTPPPASLVAGFFAEVEAAHPGSVPRTSVSAGTPARGRARLAAARKKAPARTIRKAGAARSRKARRPRR